MTSKGNKVRARKRFRDAGGGSYRTVTRGDWPGGKFGRRPQAPINGVTPNYNPEVLSRQVLRRMLREKATNDIRQQYGRASGDLFVGYLGFGRRGRRKAARMAAHGANHPNSWWKQIRTNLNVYGEKPKRGLVKDILRRIFKAPQNTLAASGAKA